jgi:type II secretory pathway pseudopilin PulG
MITFRETGNIMVFSIHKINNNEGQTLIEVLLGLLLLTLLCISSMSIFPSTALWINKARYETTAANYASAVLENLRANSDDPTIFTEEAENVSPADLGLDEDEYKPGDVNMTASIDISFFSDAQDPRRNVTVTVNWTEGANSRKVALNSIIRKE